MAPEELLVGACSLRLSFAVDQPLEFVCGRGALDCSVGLVDGEVERGPKPEELPFRVVNGGVVLARVSVAVAALVPPLVAASHAIERRGRPKLLDVPSGRVGAGVKVGGLMNVVAVGMLVSVFTVDAARGQAIDRGRGAEEAK
jgi:hypothetical protein